MTKLFELSADELTRYQWQIWVQEFGEVGQQRLQSATALISRIGGVGGTVAQQLTAAGIGRLILAHGGTLRLNDLNRQILMTTDSIDQPRVESARRQLHALNPQVQLELVAENINESNAAALVRESDIVVSAAPLFSERLLMNRESVRQGKPLVDCAMYELEGRLTTVIPRETPCLSCLYPEPPANWRREFPVFGAVASTVGSLAAMEVIKIISQLGQPLAGRMLTFDLRDMSFRDVRISRRLDCAVCGSHS
jgi:molybdopterin/thiamine biosynthesis adenylyltransferase